jgi:hypothetical protein
MIKALMKVGIEGMHLNILKAIYEKPIANIILNGKKLKPLPPKSEVRQGCPLSPLLFNIVFGLPARAIRQEEEAKGIEIGKEVNKLSLFADGMILYLKDTKTPPKPLRSHKHIQQSSRIQNIQKSVAFLYTNNEQTRKEIILFTRA